MRNFIFAIFVFMQLAGCSSLVKVKENVVAKNEDATKTEDAEEPADVNETPQQDSPDYAPIVPDDNPVQAKVTGSLFNPQYNNNIFSDIKARRVGDIITVTLTESTSAKKQASSNLGKDNSFELDPVSLGGEDVVIGGYKIEGSLNQTSTFSGNGSADQSNSLDGNISVTVVRVLPNNNLVIRGEKWLMLNNGNEFIRLTGLLRPQDVDADNKVNSALIANARIQYGAVDDLGEAQIQGWATKFLNGNTWPF
ncbi:flagellar biosynthesis protein FlgH [Moritella marina ATCC 15381]|uniref:Flagellar L-ring protein n=1 Tax=Moritella marina ATCC 15381 TaxID=1202962 RepID=A0A5J6WIF8_MORMI|nr:flagellar basal body L-ring protein FlgH [Moritella marina]QFI36565.1 flagellar biosynthesis protein FlgH [Moritella marina ATCC 15381]